jgi:1,4-alpha-glucan branching enzyme
VLNTDAAVYGGGDRGNAGRVRSRDVARDGLAQSAEITVPPLAVVLLRHRT